METGRARGFDLLRLQVPNQPTSLPTKFFPIFLGRVIHFLKAQAGHIPNPKQLDESLFGANWMKLLVIQAESLVSKLRERFGAVGAKDTWLTGGTKSM